MVKDLKDIELLTERISALDVEIEILEKNKDLLYKKIEDIEEQILLYSRYDKDDIAEILRILMQNKTGIEYMICDGAKDKIESTIIRAKEKINLGPVFKLTRNDECVLKPSNYDESEQLSFVYDFINYLYQMRVANNMQEVGYGDLAIILDEYLNKEKVLKLGKK